MKVIAFCVTGNSSKENGNVSNQIGEDQLSREDQLTQNKNLLRNFFETVVNQKQVSSLSDFVREDGTCGGASLQQMVVNPDPNIVNVIGDTAREAAREAAREYGVEPVLQARIVPSTSRPAGAPARADLDSLRDFTEHVLRAFPDMKVNIESMIAEDDKVVVRWTATGTHRGDFLGTRPTGRRVPMTNTDTFTIQDGKIVGIVAQPDSASVLRALGHLPDTPVARLLSPRADDH
jgi:predicted ester cyclase